MCVYIYMARVCIFFPNGVRDNTVRGIPVWGGYYEPKYKNKIGWIPNLHPT